MFAEKMKILLSILIASAVTAAFCYLLARQPFLPGAQMGLHSQGGLLIEYGGDWPEKGEKKEYLIIVPDSGYGLKAIGFAKRISKENLDSIYIQPSGMNGGFFKLNEGITVFLISEEFIPDDGEESDIFSMTKTISWEQTTDELVRSAGEFFEANENMNALLVHIKKLGSKPVAGGNG